MESITRKIVNKIILRSNKVCVVSLTIFFYFLKLSLLNIIFEKKIQNANDQNFFNFVGGLDKG